jgi:zinc protease
MRVALRISLLIVIAIVCGSRSLASEPRATVLPNGVRLILRPEASAELVAISICVSTDVDRNAYDDACGELAARTLFSSSLNRSREKLAAAVTQVGGSIETVRTADHVNITCVGLANQVREAVYLLCEVLKNADFGALERVRADLIAEQKRGASGIDGGLDILRRGLQARPDLAELPYKAVTRAMVGAYFRSRYVPERTAIAVVGKFDAPAIQTAFRDSLSDFDRPAARQVNSGPLYSHATNYPVRTIKQYGSSAYALVAMPAPALTDEDYPAFIVLKSVLGEGHASRLFQRLRDAQGIGYNVGAVWQTSLSDPLVAYLQWDAKGERTAPTRKSETSQPMSAQTALDLLNRQLDELISEPPSAAEVERARNLAVGREILRHERVRDRAFLLAWYEAMGAGSAFDAALPQRLAQVSKEDVLRVANKYLNPRASVILTPGQ